jgi:hypothetical protein
VVAHGGARDRRSRSMSRSRPRWHTGQSGVEELTSVSVDAGTLPGRSLRVDPEGLVTLMSEERVRCAAWRWSKSRARSRSGRWLGLRRP